MCSGFPNGTNVIPISFKVLPMVPMVIGNANGTIDSPNGTIGANGTIGKPLATKGTIGKITNGTIGRTPNGELYYVSHKGETINYHDKWTFQSIIQEV